MESLDDLLSAITAQINANGERLSQLEHTEYTGLGATAFSGAVATRVFSLPLTHGVYTSIAFDDEIYDTDDYHDIVSANERLSVPEDGYYLATFTVTFSLSVAGTVYVAIYDQDSDIRAAQMIGGLSNPAVTVTTPVLSLTAGDWLEAVVWFSNSGGTGSIIQDTHSPVFSIAKLG